MKVCFINCLNIWGGGEKWHFDHAVFLKENGHEVWIVSRKGSALLQRAEKAGLRTKTFQIRNSSFFNLFKSISVYHFFRKENFDSIIMNSSCDLKIMAPIAKYLGIKKIIYRRGSDIPISNTRFNRFLFQKCLTHILANSQATKKSILKNNPNLVPIDKITVIYNGIDISCFENVIKQEESDFDKIPVIGNLGRLVPQKRQDLLIKIAAILKNRGVKCIFKIGGDGPLNQSLIDLTKELQVEDMVQFIGFVNDVKKFMSEIDIFILTSNWEGFGYVLAEAMICKKPVIAFDVSSNPELIFSGVNGYLIPWDNCDSFANSIQKLIEKEDIRIQMGESGYRITGERFDFNKNKILVENYILS